MALAAAGILPAGNELGQVGTILEQPLEPVGELGHFQQHLRVERFHGEERDQADHGTDFQRQALAIGQVEDVVVKFVLLVPQANALVADIVHGLGDLEEMLEELGGDVLVYIIVQRQFQRDAHEVE